MHVHQMFVYIHTVTGGYNQLYISNKLADVAIATYLSPLASYIGLDYGYLWNSKLN